MITLHENGVFLQGGVPCTESTITAAEGRKKTMAWKILQAHNSGKGAKYTRGRGPVEPVYLEYCEDKVAATKREAAIKKLPLKKKQLLLSSSSNRLGQLSDE